MVVLLRQKKAFLFCNLIITLVESCNKYLVNIQASLLAHLTLILGGCVQWWGSAHWSTKTMLNQQECGIYVTWTHKKSEFGGTTLHVQLYMCCVRSVKGQSVAGIYGVA